MMYNVVQYYFPKITFLSKTQSGIQDLNLRPLPPQLELWKSIKPRYCKRIIIAIFLESVKLLTHYYAEIRMISK